MNCKQGDLAVYVGYAYPQCVGQIVRVVQRRDGKTRRGWVVEPSVKEPQTGEPLSDWIADSVLRPIRDPGDDAVDEMVLIAGLPQEVAA